MYEQELYLPGHHGHTTVYCRVLQAKCTSLGQPVTRQVIAGYIKLACSILKISYCSWRGYGHANYGQQGFNFYPDKESLEEEGYLIRMIKFANGRELCLVLKPTDAGSEIYTRVGLVQSFARNRQSLP
jgi:hypothetical protein